MTDTRRSVALLMLVAVAVWAASSVLSARDRWYPMPTSDVEDLYVTSGDAIGTFGLGFDAVLADLYWIRAVQHYAQELRAPRRYDDRYKLLAPLVDITTTLDPHFRTAHVFGALFLAEPDPRGPERLDLAVALLEKGLRAEPDYWPYAQYIGFLHYWHTGDRREAARQFERAAALPGAPVWLKPLAASMFIDGGDRDAARTILQRLTESEEPWIRDLARRKLQELGPA